MAADLRVVGGTTDADVISALVSLLRDAEAGRINGLAYVALAPGRDLIADIAGQARRDPVRTLGAMRVLELKVVLLVKA